jgi:hypothetical protein
LSGGLVRQHDASIVEQYIEVGKVPRELCCGVADACGIGDVQLNRRHARIGSDAPSATGNDYLVAQLVERLSQPPTDGRPQRNAQAASHTTAGSAEIERRGIALLYPTRALSLCIPARLRGSPVLGSLHLNAKPKPRAVAFKRVVVDNDADCDSLPPDFGDFRRVGLSTGSGHEKGRPFLDGPKSRRLTAAVTL